MTTHEHKAITYRCKRCKAVEQVVLLFAAGRFLGPDGSPYTLAPVPMRYCACGYCMSGKAVSGKTDPQVPCTLACRSAVSHTCTCSCGGANHGAAYRKERQ